jgi:hypothetical protein
VTWDYEGADVIYFPSLEEGQYDVDIFSLPKDLLYKDIPLTLYVKTKNVMDRENVFIAWDHNGTRVKYLPCAFEGVYVLDVSNLLEDLLYKDTPIEFHVYDTPRLLVNGDLFHILRKFCNTFNLDFLRF